VKPTYKYPTISSFDKFLAKTTWGQSKHKRETTRNLFFNLHTKKKIP